jgi:outer membrane immunogenic protein
MKKQLLLGVAIGALAAIAPAMAQTPAPGPAPGPWNWTGFYGGLNAGWSWGNGAVTYNEPFFGSAAFRSFFGGGVANLPTAISGPNFLDGAIGGFQLGYNWQFNTAWLAGLEADFQWASEEANRSFVMPVDSEGRSLSGTLGSQILWFGTVRGRLGWLYTPGLLVYATGGLAYGKVDVSGSFSPLFFVPGPWQFYQSAINTGWTAGGGVEGAVQNLPHVTWKVEYLYVDLGSINGSGVDGIASAGGPHPFTFNAHFIDNIFRVGLSWH